MTIDAVLAAIVTAFVLALGAVEGYTAAKGLPTISDRMAQLGRSAPVVIVIACTLLGILLGHFWT